MVTISNTYTLLHMSRLSTFFKHILHIITSSTDKQMRRIHTSRIVASMQNMKSFRYFSFMQFPRQARSYNIFSRLISSTAYKHLPITSTIQCSHPEPTTIWFDMKVNICKKSFSNAFRFRSSLFSHNKTLSQGWC
jgi:hypothetical protein